MSARMKRGAWNNAIATSFADPKDIEAFNKCKAKGHSDSYCFRFGDNGTGAWGDDTTQKIPMCALGEWRSVKDPRMKSVLVKIGNKEITCFLADKGPKGRVDLNPEACKQLGVKIPLKAKAQWKWADDARGIPVLPSLIVKIAKAEIGVEEIGNTNCGPRVNQYKAATNLPPKEAWPWCAAFIDWVVKQAMQDAHGAYQKILFTFDRPTTAGAWDLENWSKKQDASTNTLRNPGKDIEPGDIVIFTFSHVGFCVAPITKAGNVPTVEGNSNKVGSSDGGGVVPQFRKLSLIKTRIRFTV